MSIVSVRRISQAFFLLLFTFLVVATTSGDRWWQLRGWPVNLFLDLDPLVAAGVALTTGVIEGALLWAVATLVLTAVLGRFFCGWVCPFGTLHQAAGWLGRAVGVRGSTRYHAAQALKYYLLAFLLTAAAGDVVVRVSRATQAGALLWVGIAVTLLALAVLAAGKVARKPRRAAVFVVVAFLVWAFAGRVLRGDDVLTSSLLTGFMDPIPLLHRSFDLVLLPFLDRSIGVMFPSPRHQNGGWLITGIFVGALLLNLWKTRFYCRFLCPLGALFGLVGQHALWRVAKTKSPCSLCRKCDAACEGACDPSGVLRTAECVLCMNCLPACDEDVMTYRVQPSVEGEIAGPDLSRRGIVLSLASGFVAVPALRLGGSVAQDWAPSLIRPPGSLEESEFLRRCLRCGQCMRICPSNVLQPAGVEAGFETLWTPILRNRIGTSGCQLNCVACGQACPTGAIRPFTLDEKVGRGAFAQAGPLRMGTAFVDRTRCLPWAFDRPCVVCQELCPVSPKAIVLREVTATAHDGSTVRLQQPFVDPARCNGCGICEHECPVSGLRAIRVTAENESRSRARSLYPGSKRGS